MTAAGTRWIGVGVVAAAVMVGACSGTVDESSVGATSAGSADPLQVVHDSVAALEARPMSTVSVVGSINPSLTGTIEDVHIDGRYTGAAGGSAHLSFALPGANPRFERYLIGDRVIESTRLPDVRRPWTSYDPAVLDAAVAPTTRVFSSGNQAISLFVLAREPSPLTAVDVVRRSATATEVGFEVVDGRTLRRFDVHTPAPAVIDALGPAAAAHASVDCREGTRTDVWIDDTGELVQLRYRFDHLALVADVSMAFAPDPSDAPIDPPDAADVFDLTAQVATPPPLRPGSDSSSAAPDPPCFAGPGPSVGLERACAEDDPGEVSGWGALGRRADHDPLGRGKVWLSFAGPVPPAEAVAVAAPARVTGFVALYPDAGGGTVKAGFSSVDASSADAVLIAVRARTPEVSEVQLAAVLVEGPWGALAQEGSDCTDAAAELAPWSMARLFGVP